MDFIAGIGTLFCGTVPEAPELGHFIAQFINILYGLIGNYGWTVVVFTLIIKLALSPLDFWQKKITHKNTRAMARMKPKVEKLQKQYANNKELFQQKQMELYKKEGYSICGMCLPMIITLVVFFIIFAGFNSMATYMVKQDYREIALTYTQAEQDALDSGKTEEEATAIADQAVLDSYEPHGWLWIGNVFVSDNWSATIPSYEDFTSSGLSGLRVETEWVGATSNSYDTYTKALRESDKYQGWNGLLILPILTVAVTFGAQFLMKQPTPPSADGSSQLAGQATMMRIMMPVMMGFFALFYSAAFTIYLLVSQLFSLLFGLIFNVITNRMDKKEDEYTLTHTYR